MSTLNPDNEPTKVPSLRLPTSQQQVDAPTFHNTNFAESLLAPSLPQTLEPAPRPSQELPESVVPAAQRELPLRQRVLRLATTIISSNNLYTSVGNIIITANLWTGVLFQPACALLAIANEARERRREDGEYTPPPARYSGIRQRAVDLWNSPGIYRNALSIAYAVNALESLARADLFFTGIYLCASLGNVGAARTLNIDYFRALYTTRGKELPPSPSHVTALVTSPGINWSLTDILIGLMTAPKLTTLGVAVACVPTTCALTALFTPFILGSRIASSPIPLIFNGMSNLGFSVVHAFWGSPAISVACFGRGLASLLIARKQALHRKAEPQLSSQ
jgi:hypothetical protein